MFFFENIPELSHDPIYVDKQLIETDASRRAYNVNLQRFTNTIISQQFPFVASVTLKCIDDELSQSLNMKIDTLERLNKKYNKRSRNINIVNDIIIDDFDMYIADNVQLIPNAQADLMRSTKESSLVALLFNQGDENNKHTNNKTTKNEQQNIYNLLRYACEYKFTQLVFKDNTQRNLDQHMIYRIAQVWQIFQQYFEQFNYSEYLKNYYDIKRTANIAPIINIIRILVEIGPITC